MMPGELVNNIIGCDVDMLFDALSVVMWRQTAKPPAIKGPILGRPGVGFTVAWREPRSDDGCAVAAAM